MKIRNQIFTLVLLVLLSISPYLRPTQADTTNNVEILNLQTQPATIKVGDIFTVNATLVNNTPNTISVHNDCISPFSASFDNHVAVDIKEPCRYFAISKPLKSGGIMTVTGPGSNLDYRAISAGATNATITFSYSADNQTSPTSVSKSFLFTISSNQSNSGTGQTTLFSAKGVVSNTSLFPGTAVWTIIHGTNGTILFQTPNGVGVLRIAVSQSIACQQTPTSVCLFSTVTQTKNTSGVFKIGDTARYDIDLQNKNETITMLNGFMQGVQVTINLSKIWIYH